MKPSTQRVLNLLRSRGEEGVTPAIARHEVGTDRLAARVWELVHEEGYQISERRQKGGHSKYVLRHPHPLTEADLRLLDGNR